MRALKYLEEGSECSSFNLGTGNGVSVLEIINKAREISGKEIKYQVGDRRPGDPAVLIANSDKAMQILNWKPTTPLREGLKKTIAWFRDYE